jgi:hypothetical protein
MDFIRTLLAIILLAPFTLDGQDVVPPARTILDLSTNEQTAFVRRTMETGFPANRADQMTMLIINRSALALPLIEAKLEEALKSTPQPKDFVDTASEMIAYAGDETALREISKLLALDEKRFEPLVGRTLDNAENWRNPFGVVYRGLEIGDETVSRPLAAWAESALASNRMQRAWAEAMLDRYGKVPGDTEWATDPIASCVKDQASPEMRQRVMRFASEVQSRRQRR